MGSRQPDNAPDGVLVLDVAPATPSSSALSDDAPDLPDNVTLFRGSADRHLGLVAPLTSHCCVVVVAHALQHALPSPPCPARLDERLPDPTCLSAEPLT
jgi:hypothetical protein